MKLFLIAVLGMSASFARADLPVDKEIAKLRAKANYLDGLKGFLQKNRCTATIDKNTVPLTAPALRSEGLVIGVSDTFPGNYRAFHQAPKPQILANVLKAADAMIVTTQYGVDQKDEAIKYAFIAFAVPYLVPDADGLWQYDKVTFVLKLVDEKGAKLSKVLKDGRRVTAACN